MKRLTILLLVLTVALTMILPQESPGQVYRITDMVFGSQSKAPVQLKNSATDSVTGLDVLYTGQTSLLSKLYSAYPDSVRIRWFASADSTQRVLIRLKLGTRYSTTYTSALLDSVKSTTKATSTGFHTLTAGTYLNYDYFGVSLVAADTINATVTSHASKISLAIDRFFHQ